MRIGLLAPKQALHIAGGSTFEREVFQGILAAHASHTHTLVIFGRAKCPDWLKTLPKVEWVQISFFVWRHWAAHLRKMLNQGFYQLFKLPNLLAYEHWIDALLQRHRVQFFICLVPEKGPTEVPFLVFIWDIMHRVMPFFPECSVRGGWKRREHLLQDLAQKSAFISVGTEVGKNELSQLLNILKSKIKVLPFPTPQFFLEGWSFPEKVPLSLSVGVEFIFYPASFHAHKNHATILYALAFLRDHYNMRLHAVFSGGDWGNGEYILRLVRELNLGDYVHFPGFVSNDELLALYKHAFCLVFPSLLGPDNLPPLEAFAVGCPVLIADIPGAAEQTEGAALLFSPTDEYALAKSLVRLKEEAGLRNILVEAGRQRSLKYTRLAVGHSVLEIANEFSALRRCWSEKPYRVRFNWKRLLGR